VRGEDAWELDKPSLSTFFRQSDGTSAVVGDRQVNTFVALAEFSGKRTSSSQTRSTAQSGDSKKKSSRDTSKANKPVQVKSVPNSKAESPKGEKNKFEFSRDVGISVKVEVILPADASSETYENIFRSIRKNLIE
jgi:hypothetical protein